MADISRSTGSPLPLLPLLFLLLLFALAAAGRLPLPLLVAYFAASLASFSAYALDKWAAVRNRRRVSERTLHLLGLFCGWPGSAVAQRVLRHKLQKPRFMALFRATVFMNCSALALMFLRRL